jgi:hypothetical protein
MIDREPRDWNELNHRHLTAALEELRRRIDPASVIDTETSTSPEMLLEQMPIPPALETLRKMFGLSSFERDVLLLCAGVELDGGFAAAVARYGGSSRAIRPTFGMAMALLESPHWSALTPAGPLRHWRLIEVPEPSGLTSAPLRIAERVLHFLTGCRYLDESLAGLVELVEPEEGPIDSHVELSQTIAQTLAMDQSDGRPPVVQLISNDHDCALGIAVHVTTALGFHPALMPAAGIPTGRRERDELARLWERESVLGTRVLILDCSTAGDMITEPGHAVGQFLERVGSPVFVLSRRPLSLRRHAVRFDIPVPGEADWEAIWLDALGRHQFQLNGSASHLSREFRLDAAAIRGIARDFASLAASVEAESQPGLLRELCRERTRPRLDRLAQGIQPAAGWDDLVLPEQQMGTLRDIVMHVRHRRFVYGEWGFAEKGLRGLGISALFSGPSGTGKTMAAEVLARELDLDLYRIDLSQVVSKYIGETEKNLAGLFDAAEGSGVILLFDEADALFGKRSEVRDSHDRYANIEVSYLLQRMEIYAGLAILTTNLKSALDQAFLRRIRFIVQFPFPDAAARAEIWRRVFPAETPLAGVDAEKLAQLGLAGGNIRNIALNAAFLAADAGEAVGMHHLLRATRSETQKLERPLSDSEIRGWV